MTEAKTYYEKKYDDYENRLYPHEGECDNPIASVAIDWDDDKSQTVTQDFDQDGVNEKVKLSGKISAKGNAKYLKASKTLKVKVKVI